MNNQNQDLNIENYQSYSPLQQQVNYTVNQASLPIVNYQQQALNQYQCLSQDFQGYSPHENANQLDITANQQQINFSQYTVAPNQDQSQFLSQQITTEQRGRAKAQSKSKQRSKNKNIWATSRSRKRRNTAVGRQSKSKVQDADIISQIDRLSINEGAKPKQARSKSQNRGRTQENGLKRTIPLRSATQERLNYNETQLSQKSMKSRNCSQNSRVTQNEMMEIEIQDSFDPLNPYEKITINQNKVDEDIQCDVCLEFDHEEDDQIVICDLCNVAVHQSCYGGDILNKLPEDAQWFCQRCQVLVKNPQMKCDELQCFLCPNVDGAMKKIDNNQWAHIICVNWNPDIYFSDETKSAITGQVNQKRFELQCNMCKVKGKGACIQCDYKNCHHSYHARCAVRRGVIQEWEEVKKTYNLQDETHYVPIFCEKHQEIGSKVFNSQGQQALISKNMTAEFKQKRIQQLRNKRRQPNQQKQVKPKNSQKKQSNSRKMPLRNRQQKVDLKQFKKARQQAMKLKPQSKKIIKSVQRPKSTKVTSSKIVKKIKMITRSKSKQLPRPQNQSIGKQTQQKSKIIKAKIPQQQQKVAAPKQQTQTQNVFNQDQLQQVMALFQSGQLNHLIPQFQAQQTAAQAQINQKSKKPLPKPQNQSKVNEANFFKLNKTRQSAAKKQTQPVTQNQDGDVQMNDQAQTPQTYSNYMIPQVFNNAPAFINPNMMFGIGGAPLLPRNFL
ncbi:Protein Jade-3 [Oxytricha trifallax]|uniref:Protein Jade-3 n=1 Tax=Oxytricha trifallax TaxID=1172189 RepID=A0A073HZT7_9SPIT|nr:Protein Jade-3 [Oxytricha trifallax]